jgi:6-pyruvoyltetrahydropterin/6-carboxytetrahydropterin synthase
MWEISKCFRFESAHTLKRAIDAEASRRIHGHSYRAEVTLRGIPDASGMIVDLGMLERTLAGTQELLDHRFLDELPDLGPATLENLSAWIWQQVALVSPSLVRVTVYRDSQGEACTYFGPHTQQ